MTLTTTDPARTTGALPPGVVLPPALEAALAACPDLVVPSSRDELYRLALGPDGGPRFVVEYDAAGTLVPEAEVVPAWISHMDRILPKGAVVPVPLDCRLSFGAPLQLRPGESKTEFLDRLHAAILECKAGPA